MVSNKAQKAIAAALTGVMTLGTMGTAFAEVVPGETSQDLQAPANSASGTAVTDADGDAVRWIRRAGADRYATMKSMIDRQYTFDVNGSGAVTRDGLWSSAFGPIQTPANWTFEPSDTYYRNIDTAIVVSGANFADALTASTLSGFWRTIYTDPGVSYYAPIIATQPGTLTPQAKDALKNLKIANVIVLGGEASVSDAVVKQIQGLGIQPEHITRIAGADRVATAVAAYNEMIKWNNSPGMPELGNPYYPFITASANAPTWMIGRKQYYDVIIASGSTYADALSASSYAAMCNVPILLAGEDGNLDYSVVLALKASGAVDALIVGGENSVSAQAREELEKAGISATRVGGADRYQTSWMLAQDLYQVGLMGTFDNAVVASGENYADALIGAPFAAEFMAPIILVKDSKSSTIDYLKDNLKFEYWHDENYGKNYVLGGTGSVSADVWNTLNSIDGVASK